jgi:hypothetical protein
MKSFNVKIPFKVAVGALIVILLTSIVFLTCRNRKEAAVVLHPTQEEIDKANKAKREHDLFVDSANKKIASLQKQKDSAVAVVKVKDALLDAKTSRIAALTKKAAGERLSNEELFIVSCDSLIPQVNDLVESVDQLQQDNRNVQDAYDSLLGATSLKSARLEYDYDQLKEGFNRVSSAAKGATAGMVKFKRKADRKFIAGPQAGVIYSISKNSFVPYIGVGITYRLFRLPL